MLPGVLASVDFSFPSFILLPGQESWGACGGEGGTLWQVAHKIANSVERTVQELPDVQVVWSLHTTEETTLRCSLWVFGEKVS